MRWECYANIWFIDSWVIQQHCFYFICYVASDGWMLMCDEFRKMYVTFVTYFNSLILATAVSDQCTTSCHFCMLIIAVLSPGYHVQSLHHIPWSFPWHCNLLFRAIELPSVFFSFFLKSSGKCHSPFLMFCKVGCCAGLLILHVYYFEAANVIIKHEQIGKHDVTWN